MLLDYLEEPSRDEYLPRLERRQEDDGAVLEAVSAIIDDVRRRGDAALYEYEERFDASRLDSLTVSDQDFDEAEAAVDGHLKEAIDRAIENIRRFHEAQLPEGEDVETAKGVRCWRRIVPISNVGLYIPGGTAPLFSTVLMLAIPARVAGCRRIVLCTPPHEGRINPAVLYAARRCGVDAVYKVGGAQAVAALAYGTESIPKVDKIVGPGNIYVALAKKAVYGFVSIDSIAGPSEILVLADETANPRYVAADLLSQAEHDEMASAILVTTSRELADKVQLEIDGFLKTLSRREILEKSLADYGYILIAENLEEAIEAANEIASEHLEIVTRDPFQVMTKIRNAGAIFIGEYASEPLGDYFAGPNHVLPTNGTAKFFSPLSVDDFIKKSSIVYYSREALEAAHEDIETFAKAEGLTAHANSIAVRFEKKDE